MSHAKEIWSQNLGVNSELMNFAAGGNSQRSTSQPIHHWKNNPISWEKKKKSTPCYIFSSSQLSKSIWSNCLQRKKQNTPTPTHKHTHKLSLSLSLSLSLICQTWEDAHRCSFPQGKKSHPRIGLTNSREFNKNESTSLSFLPLLRERVEAHDRDSYHEFMMLGNTTTKQLTSNKTHTHTHTHTRCKKKEMNKSNPHR